VTHSRKVQRIAAARKGACLTQSARGFSHKTNLCFFVHNHNTNRTHVSTEHVWGGLVQVCQ
jgi:hypothetical protein